MYNLESLLYNTNNCNSSFLFLILYIWQHEKQNLTDYYCAMFQISLSTEFDSQLN